MGWFRWFTRLIFYRSLKHGPVSVPVRLCTSKHLGDFQFLGCCAMALGIVGICLLVGVHAGQWSFASLMDGSEHSSKVTVAFALLATAATMASWVYQSANRRIGTIDLFACEIGSICRVCLVTDFAEKSVLLHKALGEEGDRKPTTVDVKESYTPIYDKGASDLQSLENESVTAITAFYTYRKTMMDYLRLAYAATTGAAAQQLYEQMIYMQFLMYENARIAVQELTEFEPERALNLVTIFCSELPLFVFLLDKYRRNSESDFKYQRLLLRIQHYHHRVQELLSKMDRVSREESKKTKKIWIKAITTGRELQNRFEKFKRETSEDKATMESFRLLVHTLPRPDNSSHMPNTRELTAAKAG